MSHPHRTTRAPMRARDLSQSPAATLAGAAALLTKLGRAGALEGLQQPLPSPASSSHHPTSGDQLSVVKALVCCIGHAFFKWQMVSGETHQAQEV